MISCQGEGISPVETANTDSADHQSRYFVFGREMPILRLSVPVTLLCDRRRAGCLHKVSAKDNFREYAQRIGHVRR
jgi:hypothetical protein